MLTYVAEGEAVHTTSLCMYDGDEDGEEESAAPAAGNAAAPAAAAPAAPAESGSNVQKLVASHAKSTRRSPQHKVYAG